MRKIKSIDKLGRKISEEILDTKNEIVRKNLIALGWTPPKESK